MEQRGGQPACLFPAPRAKWPSLSGPMVSASATVPRGRPNSSWRSVQGSVRFPIPSGWAARASRSPAGSQRDGRGFRGRPV